MVYPTPLSLSPPGQADFTALGECGAASKIAGLPGPLSTPGGGQSLESSRPGRSFVSPFVHFIGRWFRGLERSFVTSVTN